jgi:excisionase family DNA binding protein
MSTTEQPHELLTLREVALVLRLGMRTAYKLVAEGHVPAVKVGGQWRIRRADLDRLLGGDRAA